MQPNVLMQVERIMRLQEIHLAKMFEIEFNAMLVGRAYDPLVRLTVAFHRNAIEALNKELGLMKFEEV